MSEIADSLLREATRTARTWWHGTAYRFGGFSEAPYPPPPDGHHSIRGFRPGPWILTEKLTDGARALCYALNLMDALGIGLDQVTSWAHGCVHTSLDLRDGRRIIAWPHRAEIASAPSARADDALWLSVAMGDP